MKKILLLCCLFVCGVLVAQDYTPKGRIKLTPNGSVWGNKNKIVDTIINPFYHLDTTQVFDDNFDIIFR